MSGRTNIEWTDATWNPVTGCTKISAGCTHCYIARTPPFRMAGRQFWHEEGSDRIGATTGVQLHPERLGVPLSWRKPRKVFVCSLADLFHASVPDEFIARVFASMARSPQHTFQVLTKRANRMHSLLGNDGQTLLEATTDEATAEALYRQWPLPNVWLGVSAETQQWADIRIPALLDTPAAVRWVSAEPLLGPIDLKRAAAVPPRSPITGDLDPGPGIDWVVAGGESGPGARPMHPRWARDLRDQCAFHGVPFLSSSGASTHRVDARSARRLPAANSTAGPTTSTPDVRARSRPRRR